jgi:hypothetical protein
MATALEAWAVATLPDLQGSYDYATAEKTQPLPDVGIELDNTAVTLSPPDPTLEQMFAIQQAMMRTWTVRVMLMVAPDPADTASSTLAGYIDALMASAVSDGTLGGRVSWLSKEMRGSFTPPFVQFDDGTRGRAATLELTVGELIPYEE